MLVVKIELHSARTGQITEIGRMRIANISGGRSGSFSSRADYSVQVFRRGTKAVLREGVVKDYPRLSYNVWRLVFRALKSTFREEK